MNVSANVHQSDQSLQCKRYDTLSLIIFFPFFFPFSFLLLSLNLHLFSYCLRLFKTTCFLTMLIDEILRILFLTPFPIYPPRLICSLLQFNRCTRFIVYKIHTKTLNISIMQKGSVSRVFQYLTSYSKTFQFSLSLYPSFFYLAIFLPSP